MLLLHSFLLSLSCFFLILILLPSSSHQ
jgi:hypothetical protein